MHDLIPICLCFCGAIELDEYVTSNKNKGINALAITLHGW